MSERQNVKKLRTYAIKNKDVCRTEFSPSLRGLRLLMGDWDSSRRERVGDLKSCGAEGMN